MKLYTLTLAAALTMAVSSYALADSYDTEPSSGAVTGTSGTSAINDNGDSNGLVQGSGTMQDQDNAPANNNSSTSGMSRDGETMGDEN